MTIIEPYKNNYYYREILLIGSLLLVFTVISISLYNLNVNLKYKIASYEKAVKELEVTNADMRNQMNQILDPKNLSVFIEKNGLVSDKNPDYLKHKSLAQY